ncbi:MAG: tetratricopeptide repeat protein [Bacteroidia bacterium]
MDNASFPRALLLLEQGRYVQAEQELRNVLAGHPENAGGLTLLAIALSEQKRLDEAEALVNRAIALDPADAHVHYVKAQIFYKQDKDQEAEKEIREAIRLNPENAHYYGILAAVLLDRKEYEDALKAAERGLAIDADHLTCLNLRSTILIKMNRKAQAFESIDRALHMDPENAMSHTTYGWNHLEKGNHRQALHHFQEALKREPNSEFARSGMVQALKARYLIYRLMLKYFFWISNQKRGMQWAIIIGFYVIFKVLRTFMDKNPEWTPVLLPLIILYIIFALSTWFISPLLNLILRFNSYGRYVLSHEERMASHFTAVALVAGIAGAFGFVATQASGFAALGIYGLTMMVPLSQFYLQAKKNKQLMLRAFIVLLGIIGAVGVAAFFAGHPAADRIAIVYGVGFFAFQWIANALMTKN